MDRIEGYWAFYSPLKDAEHGLIQMFFDDQDIGDKCEPLPAYKNLLDFYNEQINERI